MSEHDPNDVTTSTDLDPTSVVPTTAPLTPTGSAPSHPTPQPLEPAVAWAPAVPVATTRAPRRGGRLRWAAAIAIVALVIGATGVVAALLTAGASQSTVIGYVPANTVIYGELRLDLPGDQRQAVGEFLSKFPGFKDQAALETKIDEVLDQFVKDVSDGDQTYTTDIEPWFDRRARVQRRAAAARRVDHQGLAVDGRGPLPRPRLGQGPGCRPGLVRRRHHEEPAPRPRPRPTTARP